MFFSGYQVILILLFIIQFLLFTDYVKADEISNAVNNNRQKNSVLNKSRVVNLQALELLENIFSLEESLLHPENDQLVVLMKQELGAQILLQKTTLYIDGKLVKSYTYKGNDLEKLMSRGVLRFATLLVPPGVHSIEVEMFSLNQKPIKRTLLFKKNPRPQFISLGLVGTQIALEKWQSH